MRSDTGREIPENGFPALKYPSVETGEQRWDYLHQQTFILTDRIIQKQRSRSPSGFAGKQDTVLWIWTFMTVLLLSFLCNGWMGILDPWHLWRCRAVSHRIQPGTCQFLQFLWSKCWKQGIFRPHGPSQHRLCKNTVSKMAGNPCRNGFCVTSSGALFQGEEHWIF